MTTKQRVFTISVYIATILALVAFIFWPTILGGIVAMIMSLVCLIILIDQGKIQ
ncbi:membrane protein [Streptomyces phage Enygma]